MVLEQVQGGHGKFCFKFDRNKIVPFVKSFWHHFRIAIRSRSYKNILKLNLTWNLTNQISHVTNYSFFNWSSLTYSQILRWIFFIGSGLGN